MHLSIRVGDTRVDYDGQQLKMRQIRDLIGRVEALARGAQPRPVGFAPLSAQIERADPLVPETQFNDDEEKQHGQ